MSQGEDSVFCTGSLLNQLIEKSMMSMIMRQRYSYIVSFPAVKEEGGEKKRTYCTYAVHVCCGTSTVTHISWNVLDRD